jgi:C4-dicarboxylate transporter DctM subunit
VPFVIYGAFAQVSVGRLFLGGAIPGILMGLYLMAAVYWVAKKRDFPRGASFSLRKFLLGIKGSFFELLTPVIIVGGIISGLFTPTEAAVIGVAYAFVLEAFIRNEIKLTEVPHILLEAARLTGVMMFIIASALTYSWILMREQAGQALVNYLTAVSSDKTLLLLILIVGLLFLGAFVETVSCIIISVPVLSPLASYLGIDPIHLGVIIVLTIMIGMITPPVGLCMYIICSIANITISEFFKEVFPFFVALLLVLLTVAFLPPFTLFLPDMVMGK